MSKNKAQLCERRPSKISRLPTEEEDGPSGFTKSELVGMPVGLGAKSKVPSPTLSSFSSVVGIDLQSPSGSHVLLGM